MWVTGRYLLLGPRPSGARDLLPVAVFAKRETTPPGAPRGRRLLGGGGEEGGKGEGLEVHDHHWSATMACRAPEAGDWSSAGFEGERGQERCFGE